jgi:hypothetical protein
MVPVSEASDKCTSGQCKENRCRVKAPIPVNIHQKAQTAVGILNRLHDAILDMYRMTVNRALRHDFDEMWQFWGNWLLLSA